MQPHQPPPPQAFQPAPPPTANSHPCPRCQSQMFPAQREITQKQRVKFGLGWVLVSVLSLGLAFVLWLVTPRRKVVTGVDRYWRCSGCGTEAPAGY